MSEPARPTAMSAPDAEATARTGAADKGAHPGADGAAAGGRQAGPALPPWWRSVRFRLLAIALLPMLVVVPLFLAAVVLNWSQRFESLLIAKVNGDLTIAHQYFTRLQERASEQIGALSASAALRDALAGGDERQIIALLDAARTRHGLDFLYYLRPDGRLLAAPRPQASPRPERWPVVRQALNGRPMTAIDIFSPEDLAAISPELAARARLPLVPTRAAAPTERTEEGRGMMIHSAAPVGATGGALVAGLLLNRNLTFIDTINDLVYPARSLTEGSRGTATLFLDDVRVSTNVRLFENVRALGTRVSVAVRDAVLGRGEVWLDRAFVVNDWYISAYEPILDSFGKRVGMLYVGFLDSPFEAAKMKSILAAAIGFALLIAITVPIFLTWARSIFHPLQAMMHTIARVEAGDLGARTGISGAHDEIGRVSAHLDSLLEQIQERDRQLRAWADELNAKVEERTRDLKEANRRLEATSRQLVVSEKLAAIGEITAGIAHEINNPIAVIQGNLDVIREQLGSAADPIATELGLIDAQVHSINTLVNKLLQFARPEEYAGTIERHVPAAVVSDTIPLVQHLLNKADIRLALDLQGQGAVAMNRTEMQQILINLIVNAIHAMPEGGRLSITTRDHESEGRAGVRIEVADTGIGMSEEVLRAVFDPFFTTKRRQGTGLGLSITQKLVMRAGGYIRAESAPGKGARFTVWLPRAESEAEEAEGADEAAAGAGRGPERGRES